MKRTLSTLALTLVASLALAQAPAKPASVPGAPALSKTESLQLENLRLKSTVMQQQFQQLRQSYAQLQQQLNDLGNILTSEHPGWRFDLQTQSFVKSTPAKAKPEAHK